MSFQDELKQICNEVPGCWASVLMNLDGLVVHRHLAEDVGMDDEVLLVELTGSMKQALQATISAEGGELGEFSVSFDRGTVVARMLKDEHFVAALLGPGGLVGKGRYALRRHSLPLIQELF
jgi:predicted regulator of Ras-like GTPase activity (Roadblock/LC7/MglB family)